MHKVAKASLGKSRNGRIGFQPVALNGARRGQPTEVADFSVFSFPGCCDPRRGVPHILNRILFAAFGVSWATAHDELSRVSNRPEGSEQVT